MAGASIITSPHRILVGGGLILWALGGLATPTVGQSLSAQKIIDLAVVRAERQRELQTDLEFESTIETVTEYLDGRGQIKKTERETYRQYPVEGVLFEELVGKEGDPLTASDAREEQERRDKFVETVRQRRAEAKDPVPEDENQVRFNDEFVARYDFSIVGEEAVNDHPCWIIALAPRPGELPVRRRIDTALNNSVGRVWVSQEDYGLARVEFEMNRPVRFWGGVLGTLRNTVGRLEFARVADDVWLPTTVDIKLDLRILFRNVRRRIVRDWVEYSPARFAD